MRYKKNLIQLVDREKYLLTEEVATLCGVKNISVLMWRYHNSKPELKWYKGNEVDPRFPPFLVLYDKKCVEEYARRFMPNQGWVCKYDAIIYLGITNHQFSKIVRRGYIKPVRIKGDPGLYYHLTDLFNLKRRFTPPIGYITVQDACKQFGIPNSVLAKFLKKAYLEIKTIDIMDIKYVRTRDIRKLAYHVENSKLFNKKNKKQTHKERNLNDPGPLPL